MGNCATGSTVLVVSELVSPAEGRDKEGACFDTYSPPWPRIGTRLPFSVGPSVAVRKMVPILGVEAIVIPDGAQAKRFIKHFISTRPS